MTGQTFRRAHPDLAGAAAFLATAPTTSVGLEAVSEVLYGWYLNPTPLPLPTGQLLATDGNLSGALCAAHAERGRYQGGWRAEQVGGDGAVLARRGEVTRLLHRAEYFTPRRPGAVPAVGEALLVTAAWSWTDPETGFWHTRSGSWPPPGEDHLVRTYVNVGPADAPACVAALTGLLARHPEVPYQLKTPAAPRHGGRADAIVLYLGGNAAAELAGELRATLATVGELLRAPVPRLTRKLCDGAAQADGELGGASYGEQTCRLLAATWLALPTAERSDRDRVLPALVDAVLAAGLDPSDPSARRMAVMPGGDR